MATYVFYEPEESPDTPRDAVSAAPVEEPRRQIEREFGVPVPGEIQPMALWTNTALKTLPPPGPLDFQAIFGRDAPVMLDIGCGNARSTLASAVWRPLVDHLSTDVLPVVIRYATRRANQRGLANVKFAVIGGRELLADYIAPQSVAEIHVYHPQPFYDPKLIHKRLITPEFVALVHRSLAPGGLFVLQTDSPAIDKGLAFGESTDQRGEVRPSDNPSVQPAVGGDNSDIGAFELQSAPRILACAD